MAIPSQYKPQEHELDIYQLWEESGVFNPDTVKILPSPTPKSDAKTSKRSFSIMMPPPNANDPLHIGHAMYVVEDILIRYHRMLGEDTLWLPGTDHAGIETQFVFEKKLKKDGQSRFDFDRETLYQKIWEYVQTNSDVAVDQLKKIGMSADWSRFTFMLDPNLVEVVLETFTELHQADLIYRDLRLVNYCPKCGTAYSDLEVVHKDQVTNLYYVRYPLADTTFNPNDTSTYITLATTRPEPIFVDTHLAVHPNNSKTKHLVGRQVLNPLTNEPMDIIADEFVDPEFGTGIVKLTPAHDHADFEVAQKHGLPIVSAINLQGKITKLGGKYAGLSVKIARDQVVEDLQEKNLIEKIDTKYKNRVGTCYRCKRVLEPLPLPQFFIKVRPLVEKTLRALENNEVVIHGAGHDKILKHWLENLRDWNISRQIVWGIRIPVWYDVEKHPDIVVTFLSETNQKITGQIGELLAKNHTLQEITNGLQTLTAPTGVEYVIANEQPSTTHIQETDTFDTWFSSGQWPFSTLMALSKQSSTKNDFKRFYPTSVMETAYDILPFWVMRMLMLGFFKTGEVPFKTVYFHGLIRDQKGQKMSKSKGNVVNPLEVVDQYGADALRMALIIRSSAGLDKSVGHPDFKAARNLTNKIWNATRFILLKIEDKTLKNEDAKGDAHFYDQLNEHVQEVTQQLNDFKLGLAAETVYQCFWHWFCDECIEQAKEGKISQKALIEGLKTMLVLLHPFVPFVTERVWQELLNQPTLSQSFVSDSPVLAMQAWPLSS